MIAAVLEVYQRGEVKSGSIVWQTSVPAKSGNFKHPYSVVQQFTTGPCGAGVASAAHAQTMRVF